MLFMLILNEKESSHFFKYLAAFTVGVGSTKVLLQVGLDVKTSAGVLYQQQFQPTNKAQ